jgi:hypothetical protein
MFRLLVFVALGIALYFGLKRLTPQKAVSVKQWLIAVGVIVLVLAYAASTRLQPAFFAS